MSKLEQNFVKILVAFLYTLVVYFVGVFVEAREWVAFNEHPVIRCYGKNVLTDQDYTKHQFNDDRRYCFIVEPFTITDLQ